MQKLNIDLNKPYNPTDAETDIYKMWEDSGYFNPDNLPASNIKLDQNGKEQTYTVILPPPNVTGTLHTGHAIMLAIQDTLIRYHRMNGKRALWLPGTDHAAIATQSVVEKKILKEEKKTRHDLGREETLKRINQFATESQVTILSQFRSMGASLDWSRLAFTIDEQRNLAVKTMFKKMYDDGLIYKGHRIVNWDPKGQTTISDDELVYTEDKAKFYYFKYGPFTIGTARPETKFGDKYVVMHPDDARYANYKHGDKLNVEWINGPIEATIIKDVASDPEFGSGVMTITPWHSVVDFELAQKYGLDYEQIIDKYGKILPVAGPDFAGLKLKEAREKIVDRLASKGLLVDKDGNKIEIEQIEDYTHNISTAERTGGIIEPQIMNQWFVAVNKEFNHFGKLTTLKQLMHNAVASGDTQILPDRFEKVYHHWIDNLRDWCISRQIWYGHRVPAYFNIDEPKNEKVMVVFTNKNKIFSEEIKEILARETARVGDEMYRNNILNSVGLIYSFNLGNNSSINFKALKFLLEEEIISYSDIVDYQSIDHNSEGFPEIFVDTPPENYLQDTDTLDTWFSSGMWTFSTLGWPDYAETATLGKPGKENDLANFHPTSLLETGYDILPFWVSRMILMSTYALNEVPFKKVYLHGLVRDKEGKKMSKSLGNVLDPRDLTAKYGTDALRMSLIVSNGPGNDLKLGEDKVEAYKKFANKIWNATRFVLTKVSNDDPLAFHIDEAKLKQIVNSLGNINSTKENGTIKIKLNQEDEDLLNQWLDIKKDISKDIEEYRLHIASEKLYDYFWKTFCDVIIETHKVRINENKDKKSAQSLLLILLKENIKALHPFMPFITETIWNKIRSDHDSELLMIESW